MRITARSARLCLTRVSWELQRPTRSFETNLILAHTWWSAVSAVLTNTFPFFKLMETLKIELLHITVFVPHKSPQIRGRQQSLPNNTKFAQRGAQTKNTKPKHKMGWFCRDKFQSHLDWHLVFVSQLLRATLISTAFWGYWPFDKMFSPLGSRQTQEQVEIMFSLPIGPRSTWPCLCFS